ncbi:hypothetical protein [Streptomyces sp. NPDC058657]|uniref:hypothetical protein n=1 Tax=unclassified Streptomyces TaxID=2593676 RepID=UPI0036512DC8
MSVLLIGYWDAETLMVTESHIFRDGDQEAIDEELDRPDLDALWAYEFLVDTHPEAVQMAYDQEIGPGIEGDLVDEAQGYEPTR